MTATSTSAGASPDPASSVVELTTTRMVVGGAALARQPDGRVVFVEGALPGEVVRVRLRTTKRDFATGEVAEVVSASPDRVEQPCEAWHRGCGGCDWQHIRPDAQLPLKVQIVAEALSRTGRIGDAVVTAGGSVEPWGYRTTIRVAPGDSGRPGFRARRSHDVIEVDHCPVADPRLNELLERADRIDGEVTYRVGADDASTSSQSGGFVHVVVAGRTLRVSADSFFQSSPAAAELLVDAVRRAADLRRDDAVGLEHADVIDAYGGVGLFAATVAAEARHVELIESSPAASADARVNLSGQPATIVHGRVEAWQPRRADLVIADPARSGLGKAGVARLAATDASVFVLVSCDAGSLARDARLLGEAGYRHDGTEVVDVFPNTSHVECVSRFELVARR